MYHRTAENKINVNLIPHEIYIRLIKSFISRLIITIITINSSFAHNQFPSPHTMSTCNTVAQTTALITYPITDSCFLVLAALQRWSAYHFSRARRRVHVIHNGPWYCILCHLVVTSLTWNHTSTSQPANILQLLTVCKDKTVLNSYTKRLFVHTNRVEPREGGWYSDQDTSWTVRGSNPDYSLATGVLSRAIEGRSAKLATRIYLLYRV